MMYYDPEDMDYIRRRLLNTIVSLDDGEPIQVMDISKTSKAVHVMCHKLLTPEVNTNITLNNIDLTPVKLGWVNTKKNSHFLSRKPSRRSYQQGTSQHNTYVAPPEHNMTIDGFSKVDLRKTIMGMYPDIEAAYAAVNRGETKVGFSRRFSLTKTELFYKGKRVAGHKNLNFEFDPAYAYVQDNLNRVLSSW